MGISSRYPCVSSAPQLQVSSFLTISMHLSKALNIVIHCPCGYTLQLFAKILILECECDISCESFPDKKVFLLYSGSNQNGRLYLQKEDIHNFFLPNDDNDANIRVALN